MTPHRDVAGWCEQNPNTHRPVYHEQGTSTVESWYGARRVLALVDHRCPKVSNGMAAAEVAAAFL